MLHLSPTDNFKTLARRHNISRSDIRLIAHDLKLQVRYSADRRTWYLDEHISIVRMFNEHLADLAA